MRSSWARMGASVVLVFATVALLRLLNEVTGGTPVVGELLLPVAVAAYALGRGPGLVATAAAMAGAMYLLHDAWRLDEASDVQRLIFLVVIGVTVSVLSGWLHDARRNAAAAATARTESQERLLASQRQLAAAFEACPLPFGMMQMADRVLVAVNDAFAAFFGYTREELVGHPAGEFDFYADPFDAELSHTLIERVGRAHDLKLAMRVRDGRVRQVLASIETVTIDGIKYGVCVFTDITEKEEAERELRSTQELFSKVFAQSPLAKSIVRADDAAFVDVNAAYERLLGYTREELTGKRVVDMPLLVDGQVPTLATAIRGQSRSIEAMPIQLRRKDGAILDTLVSSEPIVIEGERLLSTTIQDVTARTRVETALRESEERFRQLAENIREVFWLYDAIERRVVYVSPAYETIWDRSCEALEARADDWLAAIHPADRDTVAELRRRQDYDQEYRIVRNDGSIRWIHDRAFPIRDSAGRIVRIAGLAEDITERRALQDQVRQTQKMESLGLLAGGVAHDFNNLLAVISSSNGMLAESVPSTGEPRELVEEIDAAVQRATGLTRQLLAFSRKQVVEPKVIDVNVIVQDTRKMLRRMVGEDVLLQTSLEPELGHVKVDPGYLVQVLMNLAVNARDAMPRGGTLEISTRRVFVDDLQIRRHPAVATGPAVELSVTDTGCGIPQETLTHIFEPFFTTKEQGRGTGMGLAVVHGIVDQAGGFIEVESTVGTGTSFRVYLPIVDAEVDRRDEVAGAAALGAERILFVDDDEYVRRAAARALRARGYTVFEAADGRAALMQLHEEIDLLLTDVVMPRMDGRELAELACRRHPKLKVLYTSGYTDDAIVRHGVADGDFDLIEKPFRVHSLATRIRQVLDR